MGKKLTWEVVFNDCNEIYDGFFKYHIEKQRPYDGINTQISIECPLHGMFDITVASHRYNGGGCPTCGGKLNWDIIIERFINKHGEKYSYYDIKDAKYINTSQVVSLFCEKHGIFNIRVADHMSGKGCRDCGIESSAKSRMFNWDIIFNRATIKHDGKYTYDYEDQNPYVGVNMLMYARCNKHGLFKVRVAKHIGRGTGCPDCYKETRGDKRAKSPEQFEKDIYRKHGDNIYLISTYHRITENVEIGCNVCGETSIVLADTLLNANGGCRNCNGSQSMGSRITEQYLIDNGLVYIKEKGFPDLRYRQPLNFDFYLPDHNILIEYDGEQHYVPIEFFGGDEGFELRKIRDDIKNKYAKDNGILLVRIQYKLDFEDIPEYLNSALNIM